MARLSGTNRRGEGDGAVARGVHQGLYPEPVTDEVQGASRVVPEPKGEHPAQTGDQALDAPQAVSMQQDFRVRPAVKARAGGGQLGCERAKVVDGAVEDAPERSVRRHHRLPPRIAEVEDGEASMAEHHAGPALDPLAVGPPPGQCAGHALDRLQRRRLVLRPDYAGDPAHSPLMAAKRRITLDSVVCRPPPTIPRRRARPATVCTKCGRSFG